MTEDEIKRYFLAARKGNLRVLRELEKVGSVDRIRNKFGRPLFHYACWNRRTKAATYLLSLGCDINVTDSGGDTALVDVARECRNGASMIRWLCKHGAKVDHRGSGGSTALIEAVSRGQIGNVKQLLRLGANPNLFTDNEEHALSYAAFDGNLEMVKALVHGGADVNLQPPTKDWRPLACAVFEKRRKVIAFLLKKGADPKDLEIPITR